MNILFPTYPTEISRPSGESRTFPAGRALCLLMAISLSLGILFTAQGALSQDIPVTTEPDSLLASSIGAERIELLIELGERLATESFVQSQKHGLEALTLLFK